MTDIGKRIAKNTREIFRKRVDEGFQSKWIQEMMGITKERVAYLSMKIPIPSVVLAAFEVGRPLGRMLEMSNPTPPRRFMI